MLILKPGKFAFVLFSLGLIFTSCENRSAKEETLTDTVNSSGDKVLKAQSVFYSIPSPIETASLLQKAGVKYDPSILNSPKNLSKYNSTESKALNLGVYGADLSFSSIFDQTQQSLIYLKATNKLSGELGIAGAFDATTLERVEKNINNRDSLVSIIADAYSNADSYLEENDRPNISSLIVAGGWIEGLNIAIILAGKTQNKDLKTRIAEQKFSLENLIGLLESGKPEATTTSVINDLKGLKALYDKIEIEALSAEIKTENNITTIGGSNKINVSEDQLADIYQKVKAIRNNIIK